MSKFHPILGIGCQVSVRGVSGVIFTRQLTFEDYPDTETERLSIGFSAFALKRLVDTDPIFSQPWKTVIRRGYLERREQRGGTESVSS